MTLDDVLAVEDGLDDELEGALAMQRLINTGTVWSLQGSFGRAAMAALEAGRNCLGRESARDYYGNTIPDRDQVKAGTKGSVQLVRDTMGDEWADAMEAA